MGKGSAAIVLILSCIFLVNSLALAENSGEEPYAERLGPLAIRNQMPLYLFYLQIVPDKAEVTEKSKFLINADYTVSNITVSAFTPSVSQYMGNYIVDIDLEVSRVTLDLRFGLYDNLEIGLEVPYLSLSRGYLDNFIEGLEDGIGARTPRSRERQGSYNFDYSLRYNGTYLIQEKHSTDPGIGDIVLNAKYHLLKEKSWFLPNVSLRSAIKFPTAEEKDLLGSGEFDYGAGILIDKGFFDRVFLYLGANVMWIESPSFLSQLSINKEYFSGLLALECFFTRRFSLVAQVTGNTTPYPYSDTNALDNDAYELGIGFNYALKEKTDVGWNFGISENITAASSPDVTFHTGLNWKF